MSGLRRFGDIRLRLIGVALISALPLVVLGVVRLTTRSLHEHATLHTEARRAAEVSAARIDERLRSADALLLGLSLTVPKLQHRTILEVPRLLAGSPLANAARELLQAALDQIAAGGGGGLTPAQHQAMVDSVTNMQNLTSGLRAAVAAIPAVPPTP